MKIYRNKRVFFPFRWIVAAAVVIVIAGCYNPHAPVQSDVLPIEDSQVERIRISAITEFVPDPAASARMQIKTLVELFNAYDSPVKASCVLRFEFYEFRPLSSDPRGRRLLIWPNQNLNDADTNDEHWKDFLRGYEFYLPLEFTLQRGKYVLEVTCLMNQQRYSDLIEIWYQP